MGIFLDVEARIGRFTASNICELIYEKGAITEGFKTICYEKAHERLGITQPPNYEGDAIAHGNENEPMAIMTFEMLHGKEVLSSNADSLFIPFQDFAGCTPDGLIGDNEGIEVKCPYNPAVFLKQYALEDQEALKKYSKAYYYQVQSCLLFSGRDVWNFVSYHPEFYSKYRVIGHMEVTPNMEDHEKILARVYEANKFTNDIVNRILNASK